MAIRARFRLPLAGFLAIFASGAFAPCAADSVWSEIHSTDREPAHVAAGTAGDPDLPVEQTPEGSGSAPGAPEAVAVEPALPAVVTAPYPLVLNGKVQRFLDRFTGQRRDVVTLWLNRSHRYVGMIREVFRSRGLPEDLAFTAMIESGFNPVAVSRAGAAGLWQFMAATARRYGLRVDYWVDERLDPEKSTFAAASYLRDLYQQFGSWTLAQAAYNAGEVKVARAIRATGSRDFWTLSNSALLKRETREFVPQIQAATMIGREPDRYGFDAAETVVTSFETVTVPSSTSLRWLAGAAGISFDTLRTLNPPLVRGVTPPGGPYPLKVPVGTGSGALVALETPRVPVVARVRPRTGARVVRAAKVRGGGSAEHVVRRRDTVSSIAQHYGVAVNDVLRWNSLDRDQTIRPGDRLRVVDRYSAAERERRAGPR